MRRLPPRRVQEYAHALEHHTNRERIVSSTWGWKRTIQMRVDEHGMFLARSGAIRHPDNDIRQPAVRLVHAVPHDVEPEQ